MVTTNRPSERDPPASGRVLVDEAEVEWLVEGERLTVHPAECLWAAWFLWRSNTTRLISMNADVEMPGGRAIILRMRRRLMLSSAIGRAKMARKKTHWT